MMTADSYKYFSLCLLYKILRLNCIPFFNSVLSPNLGLASHDTRASNNLYLSNIRRNKYGERSFFFSAILLWNNLSTDVRNASSYPVFKKKLKCLIIADAKEKC
jgi:hypothetical protein